MKLLYFDEPNRNRERIAIRYLKEIQNYYIKLPQIANKGKNVWHLFVITTDIREEIIFRDWSGQGKWKRMQIIYCKDCKVHFFERKGKFFLAQD